MIDLVQSGSDPLVVLVYFCFLSFFPRLVMSFYVIQLCFPYQMASQTH